MEAIKASSFVHIESGEIAIHSGGLIDLARVALKVFGINVLLHVALYRPHGELFGHLLTDSLHCGRICLCMQYLDHFPWKIFIQRLTTRMLYGDFFATLVRDLLFLNDHGLDRRLGGEKGALQLIYRRRDMTFTCLAKEMTLQLIYVHKVALVLHFEFVELLLYFIVCFLCDHVLQCHKGLYSTGFQQEIMHLYLSTVKV